jgi:flotillin
MLEHLDALADSSAKAISNIKFDKVVVWEGGGADGPANTAGFLRNMARVMPPMLQVMKDVGGVEVPDYLAKLVGDAPPAAAAGPIANGHPAAAAPEPTPPEPAAEKPVRKPAARG